MSSILIPSSVNHRRFTDSHPPLLCPIRERRTSEGNYIDQCRRWTNTQNSSLFGPTARCIGVPSTGSSADTSVHNPENEDKVSGGVCSINGCVSSTMCWCIDEGSWNAAFIKSPELSRRPMARIINKSCRVIGQTGWAQMRNLHNSCHVRNTPQTPSPHTLALISFRHPYESNLQTQAVLRISNDIPESDFKTARLASLSSCSLIQVRVLKVVK